MPSNDAVESSTLPGIILNRDISLSVDWNGFTVGLVEAAANFFIKGAADGGVSALVSLTRTVSSISMENTPAERAWALALFSFAFALDDIRLEDQVDPEKLRTSMRLALDKARASVDSGEQVMPVSFLDRPTTLPLYQDLKHWIISERHSFAIGPNHDEAKLGSRLDVSFNRAVFSIWSKSPELYKVIRDALGSPGALAANFDLNWKSYRQSLIQWFEVSPVFGQERSGISMSQLYIPLRGYWIDKDKPASRFIHGENVPQHAQVVMIDDELDRWIDSKTDTSWLRLIGGGPGSGKSTTLRALARRLADRDDLRPLYVPLQHIGLAENLRESINQYFTDQTSGHFTQPPLSRAAFEDGPPIVLILDGLDELAAPNEGASEVITTFASRLSALAHALRGEGAVRIRVVVSGRMPAFQAAKRHLAPTKEGCLEAYGFLPITEGAGDNPLWALDQRPVWWENYATAAGQPKNLPPAFSAPGLAGITHEPLLCYLLVLSGFATSEWERAAENPNRIYAALMRNIYDRGWGEGELKRLGAGSTLTLDDFNALMETIGLAAWLGGDTRIATEASFLQAVKITGAQSAWERFKEDNGSDVTNLAMNFYFKSSEGSQRGFEFTHKNFGEYLVALALISVASSLVTLVTRKVDHALREFSDTTRTGVFTSEILRFSRDEMALRVDNEASFGRTYVSNLKSAFIKIAQTVHEEGFPAEQGCVWRVSETQQRNSETAVWAIINSCALALAKSGNLIDAEVRIKFDNPFGVRNLLQRLSSPLGLGGCAHECLSYLNAERSFLVGLITYGLDLRGANLKNAYIDNCSLYNVDLRGANLENITISGSSLANVTLGGTNLDWFTFRETRIKQSSFDHSSINHMKIDLHTAAMSGNIFINLVDKVRLLVTDNEDRFCDAPYQDLYERFGSAFPLVKSMTPAKASDNMEFTTPITI